MELLYEDSQIIVCYKEAGLPVQSARMGIMDLESMLKNYLCEKGGQSQPYLGVVHRLDQPVEGLLVFAKTPKAAAQLGAQAADERMKKLYHAIIKPERQELPENGCLTDYLVKDGRTNTSRIVSPGTKGAKKAVLDYRILGRREAHPMALTEIHLHTGRHHQIRVQMAGAGMPLYGDRKYGVEEGRGALALCAVSLKFIHPGSGKPVRFSCEPKGEYFHLF